MSNVVSQRALDAGGAGQFILRLAGPAAYATYATAGGPNVGTLTNQVGDVRITAGSAGNQSPGGVAVQALTGYVGIGTFAPAYPMDVSGSARFTGSVTTGSVTTGSLSATGNVAASYFIDASGNRLLNNSVALWSSSTVAFLGDDGSGSARVTLNCGSGSLACRYFWFGAMVTAEIKMVVGSSPSLGLSTQGWCWTLPVAMAASSADTNVGSALLRSYSGGVGGTGICYTGVAYSTADGTAVKVLLDAVSTLGVSSTVPFAWSPGDSVSILMSYEASGVQQPAYVVPVGLTQSVSVGSNCMGLGLAPGAGVPTGTFVVAGSVGIGGTASPAAALDVVGSARASVQVSAPIGTFLQLYASNVAVLGSVETVNAYETHTSNVVIANQGTGPALQVSQSEYGPLGPQPVATFTAGSNVALVIDNVGHVAVGKASAACTLDVSGSAAVSGQVACSNVVTGPMYGSSLLVSGFVSMTSNLSVNGTMAATTHTGTSMTLTGAAQAASLVSTGTLAVMGTSTHTGTSTLTGNVGIGKAPTSYPLDVSWSVNVSGTLTAGSVGFRFATVTGTLLGANTSQTVAFPTGVTYTNIIMANGFTTYSGIGLLPFTYYTPADSGWIVALYPSSSGYFQITIPSTSTNAAGHAFTLYIMYAP